MGELLEREGVYRGSGGFAVKECIERALGLKV
jgi:hypothetical protein